MRHRRLASDDRNLAHGRLTIGVEELRATANDALVFLVGAGEEAGHVDELHDRNVERVARTDEARTLLCGLDVEAACELHRLVCDNAHGATLDAGEAHDEVFGVCS